MHSYHTCNGFKLSKVLGVITVTILLLVNRKSLFQAHIAIAECEKRFKRSGRKVTVITQNIDGLHKRAGSNRILELHGN